MNIELPDNVVRTWVSGDYFDIAAVREACRAAIAATDPPGPLIACANCKTGHLRSDLAEGPQGYLRCDDCHRRAAVMNDDGEFAKHGSALFDGASPITPVTLVPTGVRVSPRGRQSAPPTGGVMDPEALAALADRLDEMADAWVEAYPVHDIVIRFVDGLTVIEKVSIGVPYEQWPAARQTGETP